MARIEVISGPMFSGKTTELVRRLERYSLANKKVVYFKPPLDLRTEGKVMIASARQTFGIEVLTLYQPVGIEADVVAIDEAQFLPNWIVDYCQSLRDQGKIVIICGLDMDARRLPFGSLGHLMAIADSVSKLTAVCACGQDAVFTWLKDGLPQQEGNLILLGSQEKYEPCCGECYNRKMAGGI